ncbi:MAG: PAS domain-containing sensor histidine kinase [Bacteroidota bacterium]
MDALVVSGEGGEQVYTLKGADHSYRVLLEGLNEAALTFTAEGTILYCNSRFTEMTKLSSAQLLGSPVQRIIKSTERKFFEMTLRQLAEGPIRREFNLRATDRSTSPVLFSIKNLALEDTPVYCVVVTDISDQKQTEKALQKSERHYRKLFLEEQRIQGELRRLSRGILRVQEEERARISREIHDEIGQTLTAIGLNLRTLKSNAKPSEIKRKVQSVQNLLEKAADFIHVFSHQIHPSMLEDLGLIPALRSFIRDFQKNTGMRIQLMASGTAGGADIDQKAGLYRIVQESLTNVLKHSGTQKATVTIRKTPHAITLEIVDDGKGFDPTGVSDTPDKRPGIGVLGMRERARLIGGKFEILSQAGKGTRVRVHLPLGGTTTLKEF